MTQWMTGRKPGDMIMDTTLMPLKPGAAAICTSKCFKCSTHGHRAAQCVLADNYPACLSREEAHWCMICRSILGLINKGMCMDIHLIFNGQGGMWQEWGMEEQDLEEGKAEGSSM
jgi:hypothetical protein